MRRVCVHARASPIQLYGLRGAAAAWYSSHASSPPDSRDVVEQDDSGLNTREPFPGPPIDLSLVGSTYFFGEQAKRKNQCAVPSCASASPPQTSTTLVLRGNAQYVLDTTHPPLDAEGVERALLAMAVFTTPNAPLNPNATEPCLLLSPDAIVHQLGPEMEAVDAVFRQKGFYTPSEVAQAFVAVTPTYFVETRHVLSAVAPAILYELEKRFTRGQLVSHFIHWYPMVFTIKRGRMQKTVMKLNSDMWFIRAHPDYKKADALHYRNNADYNVAMGGLLSKHVPGGAGGGSKRGDAADLTTPARTPAALDAQIASILIRHLPRVSAAACDEALSPSIDLEAKRTEPLKLIDWINGFPQEEIDVLNCVPQHHLLQLVQRYHGVFQLLCLNGEDPFLFTPSHALKPAAQNRVDFVATMPESPSSPRTTAETTFRAPWEDELESFIDNTDTENEVDVELRSATEHLDAMYIRRRPKYIAPHSLSDFSLENSPLPDVVRLAARYLALPPTLSERPPPQHPFQPSQEDHFATLPGPLSDGGMPRKSTRHPGRAPVRTLWRWVPVDRIYQALSKEHRRALRPYKGLVNFLRLHGTLFELSEDLQHVIAHDPDGVLAPLVPTQTSFRFESRVTLPADFDTNAASTALLAGERERERFQSVLGKSQIPTTRRQILLLDPHNPVLFHEVVYEEIANLLPDAPVTMHSMMRRLPPILRAALSHNPNFASSRFLLTWEEKGVTMVQRSDAGKPEALDMVPCSVEEAVEAVYTVLPVGGVTVKALKRMYLSVSEVAALSARFGTVLDAVRAFPQFFDVMESPSGSVGDTLIRPRE